MYGIIIIYSYKRFVLKKSDRSIKIYFIKVIVLLEYFRCSIEYGPASTYLNALCAHIPVPSRQPILCVVYTCTLKVRGAQS